MTTPEPSSAPVPPRTSLHDLILAARTAPPPCIAGFVDRVWVIHHLAGALAPLHASGLAHGGLRPACVLVDDHGAVVITGPDPRPTGRPAPSPYRAPEADENDLPDRAGDIYAVGAIMWELLTLRPALVVEENLTRYHRRKLAGEVDALPAEVRATVPEELLAIARRAMAPDPDLRWPGLSELVDALRTWLRSLESHAITAQAERRLVAQSAITSEPRVTRRRWRGWMLAALLAVVAGAVAWNGMTRATGAWRTETEWILDRGARTTGLELSVKQVDEHEPVPVPLEDGLEMQIGSILWLNAVDGRGDIRFGVDLEWTRHIDGFELMVAAPRIQPTGYAMTQPGYSCQFGGFRGTQTFLSSSPVAGWPQRPAPIPFAYEPNRRYRLELERSGEHLRLRVDGTTVWDQREIVPVGDSTFRWLALRSWCKVKIHRIFVEKPVDFPATTPLSTADALAAAGHHADALAAYRSALQGPLPDRLLHQAIAKAHLVASRLPSTDETRHKLLLLAETSIPEDSPYLQDVLQAEALALWRARDWNGALQLAERLQQRYPGTRAALALLEKRTPDLPEGTLTRVLRLIAAGPPLSHLSLVGMGIHDLAPLSGMRLESLDITGNLVADLGPLAGMPLRRLLCSGNRIADLSPLAGLPLLQLEAGSNRITDLTPLAGMPLELLHAEGNGVRDLAPLAGMPLERLRLERNPVASLEPLRGCTRLLELSISDAPVNDLSPVPTAALTWLSVARCPVADLAPLADHKLAMLDLSGTRVTDLGPLPRNRERGLNLRLTATPITSLATLKGLTISQLHLSQSALADLDGIAELRFGKDPVLVFDGTPLTSLAPLAQMSGLAYGTISLRQTRITDLAPLAGSTIARLHLDGVPATGIDPLHQVVGLRQLTLWGSGLPAGGVDGLADFIGKFSRETRLANDLHLQAAAMSQDWRRLRAMSRRLGARDRLPLPIELPLAEAKALAAAAGAHLPCPVDPADLRAIASAPGLVSWFWTGLLPRSDPQATPRWVNQQWSTSLILLMAPRSDPYAGEAWICPPVPIETNLRSVSAEALPATTSSVILEW